MSYKIYRDDWGNYSWHTINYPNTDYPPVFADNYINNNECAPTIKDFERLQTNLNKYKYVDLSLICKKPRMMRNGQSVIDDEERYLFDLQVFICQKYEEKFNVKFDWDWINGGSELPEEPRLIDDEKPNQRGVKC